MRTLKYSIVVLVLVSVISACSKEQSQPVQQAAVPEAEKQEPSRFDVAVLARGALLYQQNCAECHGPEAQGHPDWSNAKQRGYSAAPPLDGTGPAKKLRQAELISIIKNGVKYNGKPVMPAWQGRVSDDDIKSVITWFQALWPGEVYANWQKDNR